MQDLAVNSCPSCNRRVFARRDMLYAAMDGTVQCRACGRPACLDLLSRWAISCVIALVLPVLLLYGDIFYSGHLFLFSMVVILGAWRLLSSVAFPFLTLEAAPGNSSLERKHTILVLVALLVVAIAVDGLMASRFEPDSAMDAAPQPASARSF